MRWRELFADLEAQLAAAEAAELAGEVADRSRRELAAVPLAARLRANVGAELEVRVGGHDPARGRLLAAGADWLLLAAAGRGEELLVVLAAVGSIAGLPSAAAADGAHPAVQSRLGLAYALRRIARDRSAVRLGLRDGTRLFGTIDGVGADALDLAEHEPGEPRRPTAVAVVRSVPFAALATVSPA